MSVYRTIGPTLVLIGIIFQMGDPMAMLVPFKKYERNG